MSLHAMRSVSSPRPAQHMTTGRGSVPQAHLAGGVSVHSRYSASGPFSSKLPVLSRTRQIQANGSSFERRAQDTGRQAESAARETGSKLERGTHEILDKARQRTPDSPEEASGEAKSAASRAGQTAQQQYEDPTERAKFVAEFSATALFTFLTATATAAATASASSATQALLWRMAAYGTIFPLIISIFAPVSKAHFNPMVTISMVAAGQQSLVNGLNYIVAQCLGAIAGAALAFWSLPGAHQTATFIGAAAVPAGRSVQQAFLGELLGGLFFIYVLFATIVDPRGWGKLGPLSLGLTVPLLMWSVGPISSLSINPARAFGTAVVTGVWRHQWLFWTAPVIAGAFAGYVYSTFFAPTAANV